MKKDNLNLTHLYGIGFLIMMMLFSVPAKAFRNIGTGLDASWAYALNDYIHRGIIWGRDVVFTYGPLGFLIVPENVGNNMLLSCIFWLGMLCIHCRMLYQMLFKNGGMIYHKMVLISSALLYALSDMETEYYLCYLGLLAILLAWHVERKYIWTSGLMLILSFYMKFSSFLILLSGLLVFLLLARICKVDHWRYYTFATGLSAAAACAAYLVFYEHSFSSLMKYIYGSLQMAGGYNAAMSVSDGDVYVVWVVVIAGAWLFCCIASLQINTDNFILLAMMTGPLFFLYKHAFVRADAHVDLAFFGILWVLSVMILFFRWDAIGRMRKMQKNVFMISVIMILLIPVSYVQKGGAEILASLRSRVIDLPDKLIKMSVQDVSGMEKLPEQIVSQIGDSAVSIYPWEIAYLASNELNYLPIPGMQVYSLYTPYLDSITSDFYAEDSRPQYIILTEGTIDGRWGYMECPKTWRSIREHYTISAYHNGVFLLQKNDMQSEAEYEYVHTVTVDKMQKIDTNEADGYIKVKAEMNVWGRAAKLLWKVPEVTMRAEYEDGTIEERRILLDNLINGADVHSIVHDQDTLVDYLNYNGNMSGVKNISFSGAGLKFYKNNMEIAYYRQKGSIENRCDPVSTYLLYAQEMDPDLLKISDFTETEGKYTVDSVKRNADYCRITGWGFAESFNKNNEIFLECDGKFYQTKKTMREDVANEYHLDTSQVGFEILLDQDVSDYTIYCIDRESRSFFKSRIE